MRVTLSQDFHYQSRAVMIIFLAILQFDWILGKEGRDILFCDSSCVLIIDDVEDSIEVLHSHNILFIIGKCKELVI